MPKPGAKRKYEHLLPKMEKLREQGWSYARISEEVGCAKPTVVQYLRPEERILHQKRVIAWQHANPERQREHVNAYIERHPEVRTHWRSVYRVRVASGDEAADQSMPLAEFEALYRSYVWCADCSESFDDVPKHLHHKLPVSQGGLHIAENLVCLCPPCHRIQDTEAGAYTRSRETDDEVIPT